MSRAVSLILEVASESATHLLSTLPLLFAAYLATEMLSHNSNRAFGAGLSAVSHHPVLGPAVAAALALLPQCGFATAATVMYLDGLIPRGTLLASYIATSDEALPVLVSDEGSLPWVVPLLIAKFAWGAMFGIALNFSAGFFRARCPQGGAGIEREAGVLREHGGAFPPLCGRPLRSWRDIVTHAAARTVRVGLLLFVFSSGFHVLAHLGLNDFSGLAANAGVWKTLVASVVGLFPSCATSVGIAGGFQRGILSFPDAVAGLVSNAGVALALLFKEARSKRDALITTTLLVVAAFVAGLILRAAGVGS